MKISIKELRCLVNEELRRMGQVDLDPSNNPGRPADAMEYLGMHPKPTAAMSHPYADGAGPSTSSSSTSSGPDGSGAASGSDGNVVGSEPSDEPIEET